MGKTRVRDARLLPAVCLSRADLAVLGERVESRRLASVRSCYMALLELAGETDGWTKGQLAARAGVGNTLLNDCLTLLTGAGMVRVLEDGSLQLSAPSGQETLPVVAEPELRVVAQEPDELDRRARGFLLWHSERIGKQTGKPAPSSAAALASARRILSQEPDGARIKARIEWALTERFYADKVVTLQSVERWWQRTCLAFDAAQGQERPQEPSGALRTVSYDGERVAVA